jgi:nitrite reductase (NADH) large subunit
VPVSSVGVLDPQLAREPLRLLGRGTGTEAYLTLALARGRLVGVAAVGDVPQLDRLHEAVLAGRRVWPWQRLRWRVSGRLWPEGSARSVCDWPAQAVVCQCNQVTRGALDAALARGCTTLAALTSGTRAGSVCGSCKPLLGELLASRGQSVSAPEPARAWRLLGGSAAGAAAIALLLLALPGWAYWLTVQDAPAWQRLWTESLYKQLSGYTVAALALLGLGVSLRKRVRAVQVGAFDLWRLLHVALGVLALLALLVHTGARLGARLDAALMLSFAGLALVGAAAALVVAFEHRLPPTQVRSWRNVSGWMHILLSWPLPVLLGLHVLKSYWF